MATIVVDALEAHCNKLFVEGALSQAEAVADEMMRDQYTRFALAVADLELLLTHFIGRPEATMQQVREHRQRAEQSMYASRPHRQTKHPTPISDELRRSIMSGRIGDPREPGSDV